MTPKYMVLSSTWIPQEPNGPWRVLQPGETVEFLGIPGSSLAPMNAAAAKRVPGGRPHMQKMARRFRRQLNRQDAARLAAAEAQMERA